MANIKFTIPSILNKGGGERKIDLSATTLSEAFTKISEELGDEFKRRVLNPDGSPRSLINIYINGKNMRFSGGMEATLRNGDEIYLLPAVAGGSELSNRDLERYSRQVMLEEIGYQGQLKLKKAKACIVGVGGLGNPIAMRLVAMGVGKIRVVDRDVIELSNL
ncbi:MAG: 4-methyl-5(B-hydroxyethyl)-thiazole monophosphate biosynthesis protein, partial [Thaumarchaeota archaeon]